MQKAVEATDQSKAQPAKAASTSPPIPLPAKLVVSASKKALDAVAAGKMSFEEFKKAANVEYLSFPSAEKK